VESLHAMALTRAGKAISYPQLSGDGSSRACHGPGQHAIRQRQTEICFVHVESAE